jgi:hypothetical protein
MGIVPYACRSTRIAAILARREKQMFRLVGAKALRFTLLSLLVLAVLPVQAGAHKQAPDTASTTDLQYFYYVPVAFKDAHPDMPAPDLVVESITVNSDSAVVVIKNQGGAPALHIHPFWVDLYIDPDPMPTAPNETWDRSCKQGIVWAVPPRALPLDVGTVLTLTYCAEQEVPGPYYSDEFSKFEIALTPGTPIAVQVDSANADTTYGGVLEEHEILGRTYNNISTTVSLAGSGCGTARPTLPASDRQPLAQPDGLPARPSHSE